jgi:hypothetical protein
MQRVVDLLIPLHYCLHHPTPEHSHWMCQAPGPETFPIVHYILCFIQGPYIRQLNEGAGFHVMSHDIASGSSLRVQVFLRQLIKGTGF